ncbi:thiamine-binding protein [Gemelliphila palaticanis]|uniref:Thiamine-binding protein n=1 Tax=Gemelliphila palaticanis TaxID=81950 RepID=A0ABX2SXW2_9BACL|nr:thiamine-binding protein [Gemella palaticanis]MBF0715190.1 thiamine-binding protein [Gemella palaticanis]NYS47120.1 thiamine-binding protein [Gemella palaticanis]
MLNCSIAIQILPLGEKERIDIIDKVIAYIKSRHSNVTVSPFETVIEGEYEELMTTLKQAILIAGEDHSNIFANVKINYGRIMTIDEKISKFN